ncbi:hypothetical protein D1BOALGB6SA_2090 [Olavius sp. associated proteobacterium Delta 1]|nr:hypothetical protein D1BOALGB6SA_2090 [Olavius sp. associated proteobacterium Delta 1]
MQKTDNYMQDSEGTITDILRNFGNCWGMIPKFSNCFSRKGALH